MRIVGFNLEKIEAEKKKAKKGKININSNVDVTSIDEQEIDMVDKKQTPLKIGFKFTINYSPDMAKINLEGNVIALLEKKKAKQVQKKWKKKEIPDEVRIPVFNTVLKKCSLRALRFEEEFNLPIHIPMPQVGQNINKKKAKYTG